jgi:hypothetical protein
MSELPLMTNVVPACSTVGLRVGTMRGEEKG